MKTEKWVPCTEELAENPERVKAWSVNGRNARFLTYDKGHERPIIVRGIHGHQTVSSCHFHEIECLIEVPIQERFVTFYEGDSIAGASHLFLEKAIDTKLNECTHIVKLTFDGKDFKAECVWTKEST